MFDDNYEWGKYLEFMANDLHPARFTIGVWLLNLGHNLERIKSNDHVAFLESLMFLSAEVGNVEALDVVLTCGRYTNGFEVNRLFSKTKTAAYIAAENGHINCVKVLRRHGALKHYRVKYYGSFSIVDAALTNGYKYA